MALDNVYAIITVNLCDNIYASCLFELIWLTSSNHVISRGGSNSIVLQYHCKVLQYFGIVTSQNNSISIAKSQSIAILIAKFSSIVKSIAKIFKYCK